MAVTVLVCGPKSASTAVGKDHQSSINSVRSCYGGIDSGGCYGIII